MAKDSPREFPRVSPVMTIFFSLALEAKISMYSSLGFSAKALPVESVSFSASAESAPPAPSPAGGGRDPASGEASPPELSPPDLPSLEGEPNLIPPSRKNPLPVNKITATIIKKSQIHLDSSKNPNPHPFLAFLPLGIALIIGHIV